MNGKEFVDAIKEVVIENSIKSMLSILSKPTGRKPAEKLLKLSAWYNGLNENDRQMISEVIRESVEMDSFSWLCVLDGVRAIENENKGEIKLYYQNGDTQIVLNDPEKEYLHDLL